MKQIKRLAVMIVTFSLLTCMIPLENAYAAEPVFGTSAVTAAALNIRTDSDTSAPIGATLSQGDVVVVLDIVDDIWYYVNHNGDIGYVASLYMSEISSAENFDAAGELIASDVRMRSTPSTDGSILGTYSSGTVMHVIGINDGWYKVSYAGLTGYIRSDFMTITGDSSTLPEESTFSLGQEIAEYALQFVGYRYVYGASSPSVGFDCSGFTYYIYGKFGYGLSRRASLQYQNNGVSVSKNDLQPGDLLFFSSNGYSVTHVGLYIGDNQFVHASTSTTGVIISSLTSSYYTRVWFGAKRII